MLVLPVLYSRQRNHVSICQSCKRALGWFEPLQMGLKVRITLIRHCSCFAVLDRVTRTGL